MIKKVKYISFIAIGLLIGIPVFLHSLLNMPFVQQQITSYAVNYLKEKLNTEVSIEKSHIDLLGRLELENLYVEDLNNDTLLSASKLVAGVDIRSLFRKQLVFSTFHLSDFHFHLTKENPDAELNLQFVIDAFKSKEEKKDPLNINLRINSILMRKGHLTYDVLSEPETPSKFNSNHLGLNDFNGIFSGKQLSNDSLNVDIRNCSFVEKSGFCLKKLMFKVAANRTNASITDFGISLPETVLRLDSISANYDLSQEHIIENMAWNVKVLPSQIKLKDLSAFVPVFEKFSDQVELSTHLKGTLNHFHMEYLTLSSEESLNFSANMEMRDALLTKDAFVSGKIEHLSVKASKLAEIMTHLSPNNGTPKLIANLGNIRFQGDVSGYFDDLVAYGNFATALGSFSTDLKVGSGENIRTFKGSIKTGGFELGKLLNKENTLGNIALKVDVDAKLTSGHSIPTGFVKGLITQVDIKNYVYNNIEIDGNFSQAAFEGKISLDDPNGKVHAEGLVNLSHKIPTFNFNLEVEHFRAGELNLSEKYKNSNLSFAAQVNFEGNRLDDALGHIHVNNLNFHNDGNAFSMQELKVDVSGISPERKLTIHSDIINGEIAGSIYFMTLGNDVKQIASTYLPIFVESLNGSSKNQLKNVFSGNLVIENIQSLTKALDLPVHIVNQANLLTQFDANLNKLKLEFFLPKLAIGKTQIETGKILLQNPGESMQLHVTGKTTDKKKRNVDISLISEAKMDTVFSHISFNNNDTIEDASGSIKLLAAFEKKDNNKLKTLVQFTPSTFTFQNKPINVKPSTVEIFDKIVSVNHFSMEGKNEHIRINGMYSKTSNDTLFVDLHNTDLQIIQLLTNNSRVLNFGGLATGKAYVVGKEDGLPILFTNLNVNNFAYNEAILGELEIFGKWNESNQGILMDGRIYQENELPTTIYGHIFPTKDSLDILFDTNHINLRLLDPFVKNVMNDMSGWGYGKIRLFGNFKRICFSGSPYVKDVNFGVDFLNTRYSFSDTLYMTPKNLQLVNTTMFDESGNRGTINAAINHHFFDDITYEVSLRTPNLHIYNAGQKKNPVFFGSVYGSGTASLKGDLDGLHINANMRSERNSKLTLSFFENISVSTLDFITFVEKEEKTRVEKAIQKPNPEFEVDLKLEIQATPDATLELIVDKRTGDILSGNGTGSINLAYNTRRPEDVSLHGTYSIQQGNYNFTWEEVIKKDFTIRNGSTVSFQGDPNDATINVTAVHSLSADISSLESSLNEESGRQNVPVEVVIHLSGKLEHPEITPSIELPNSGDDVRRKVNGLIYTQNDITKQVFYLLLFGQFDAIDQVSVSNSNSAQLTSVVSSTLSSQLNTFLSQITNKVNIGTSIQSKNRGGFQDLEVGLNISTKIFDDRVILKSNLGYRDNVYQSNNFIGDFDLEYKLSRSGDIRLKGYSHYNDNSLYYGRSGLTTQGVGIMYTKDFTRLPELLRRQERRRYALEQRIATPEMRPDSTMTVIPHATDSISVK